MIKLTKNISLEEVVHPDIFRQWGAKSKWFLDKKIIDITQAVCDDLAEHFGRPVKIRLNTWPWKGRFKDKGLRQFNSVTGSAMSDHKFGRATDPEYLFGDGDKEEIDPDFIREFILERSYIYMKMGLTTLEHKDYAPGWVHMSTRWTGLDYILIVKPRNRK